MSSLSQKMEAVYHEDMRKKVTEESEMEKDVPKSSEMIKDVPKNQEIRGLRRCKSTVCHGRLVSRDRNSALNILECYKAGSGNRPDYLRRAPISHPGMLDHRVTVI